MKLIKTAVFTCLAALTAATAWAQFGMLGSPEMLPDSSGFETRVDSPTVPCSRLSSTPPMVASYALPGSAPTRYYAPRMPAGQYAYVFMTPAPPPPAAASDVLDSGPAKPDTLAPNTNVVDQLLTEPGYGGPSVQHGYAAAYPSTGVSHGYCGPMTGMMPQYEQAACGCGTCAPRAHCPWYGSALALVMGRNSANRLWTTYENGNNPNQLWMNTRGWNWGGEILVGRRFCRCGSHWALEGAYWTLDPFEGMASISHENGVSTPLVVSGIEFGGLNGTLFFDSAVEHRLWRRHEVHSAEVSLVNRPLWTDAYQSWGLNWSLGFRYFRFEDQLIFGSLGDTTLAPWNQASRQTWGADGGIYEAYLNDHVTNDLFGFQFGLHADCYVWRSVRLFITPKFGIYDNYIDHTFNAYLGDGTIANPTAASQQSGSYPVRSTKHVVSFLTQIDLGVDWRFARRWSVRGGYRAVVATGIALADEQIPPYIVDIPELARIDHNANLILHGAFVGVTYNF